MAKLIAAINMTLDGFCDHTAVNADEETHEHYNDLLRNAGGLIYGRKTYQLMESYWPLIVKDPTGNQSTDDFALLIDNIPKIVFSRTLNKVDWKNTVLKHEVVREDILEIRESGNGKDIFVGSPSMIVSLTNLELIDEFQICVHPVITGSGLALFKDIKNRVELKLIKTKTFNCGAVVMYYETCKK